jgi:uncharacterized protein (TIGR02246 family)
MERAMLAIYLSRRIHDLAPAKKQTMSGRREMLLIQARAWNPVSPMAMCVASCSRRVEEPPAAGNSLNQPRRSLWPARQARQSDRLSSFAEARTYSSTSTSMVRNHCCTPRGPAPDGQLGGTQAKGMAPVRVQVPFGGNTGPLQRDVVGQRLLNALDVVILACSRKVADVSVCERRPSTHRGRHLVPPASTGTWVGRSFVASNHVPPPREDRTVHKTNQFVITCLLAALASPSLAKTPDSSQACWQPAFESGNADAVARCYAPDAVLWLPGAPRAKGRDAIRAAYAGFFAGSRIRSATLTELGKVAHGDDASSWGTFKVVLVSKKDGKETTETGRYTDVSRRIDGRWQYLVDHASDEPSPGG